jgi:hypothetical protein
MKLLHGAKNPNSPTGLAKPVCLSAVSQAARPAQDGEEETHPGT